MKEQFVTYEIALEISNLGFNQHCLMYFDRNKELKAFPSKYYTNSCIELYDCKFDNYLGALLWQEAILFINNLLLKSGYETYSDCYLRSDFKDLKQLENRILTSLELITK